MDGMIWIHADEHLQEIRELSIFQGADMQIDVTPGAALIDNTFSITLPESVWAESPIQQGHFVYAPGTEWGGPVTYVKHATDTRLITLQGPTWRGLMHQKRIMPPAGAGYLVLENVDGNELIRQVLGNSMGALFRVAEGAAGKTLSASFRYQSMAAGLQNALRGAGMRLQVTFDNTIPAVLLSAQIVADLSATVEISQDYGVNFVSALGNVEEANHCLALGQGELENRMVVNVWRVGNTYYTERPATLEEKDVRTVLLDYPNAETEAELTTAALKRLQERAPAQSIQVNEALLDISSADLGDKIAVRDRVTGLYAKPEIVGKILNIAGGRTKIEMTVDVIGATGASSILSTWGDLLGVTWGDLRAYAWGDFIEA